MEYIKDIEKKILIDVMLGKDIAIYFFKDLPKDDSLRTFICELSPKYAYYYAFFVDRRPHVDTRNASCKNSKYAWSYALYVDKKKTEETWKAVSKDLRYKSFYEEAFGG